VNQDDTTPQSNRSTSPTRKRQKSVSHPRYTLQQAVELSKAVYEEGPFNVDQERLAQRVGYSAAQNGAYIALRATASAFGLITTDRDSVSVTGEWNEVLFSEDEGKFRRALKDAMRKPGLYKQIIEDFDNRQLPETDRLARLLYTNPKYGILKEAANTAARIFIESATYAGVLNSKGYLDFQETPALNSDVNITNEERDVDFPVNAGDTNRQEKRLHQGFSSKAQDFLSSEEIQNLDRIEVRLSTGKKAYLFLPVPILRADKDRLKAYIDLLVEEPFSTMDSSL
jgi:hypothetical protein